MIGFGGKSPTVPVASFSRQTTVVTPARKNELIRIAHRGLSRFAPENTIAALVAAFRAGADGVEIDVKVSTDGVYFLFHDDTLDRTTNASGDVHAKTWGELEVLDAGSWKSPDFEAEPIPTLAEALAFCRGKFKIIHLELKQAFSQPQVDEIVAIVAESGVTDVLVYDSFRVQDLQKVRLADPEAEIVLHHDNVALVSGLLPASIAPSHNKWTPELVEAALQAGVGMVTYTVNTAAGAAAMVELGVTRIFQDLIVSGLPRRDLTVLGTTPDWNLSDWAPSSGGDISVDGGVATLARAPAGPSSFLQFFFPVTPEEIVHAECLARGQGRIYIDFYADPWAGSRLVPFDSVPIGGDTWRFGHLAKQVPNGATWMRIAIGFGQADEGEVEVKTPRVSIEGWRGVRNFTPDLLNGWAPYSGSPAPTLSMEPDGTVRLSGLIAGGDHEGQVTVIQLPVYWRPREVARHFATTSNHSAVSLTVRSTGSVQALDASPGWLALDAVVFRR